MYSCKLTLIHIYSPSRSIHHMCTAFRCAYHTYALSHVLRNMPIVHQHGNIWQHTPRQGQKKLEPPTIPLGGKNSGHKAPMGPQP